jgi:hypothetical protein
VPNSENKKQHPRAAHRRQSPLRVSTIKEHFVNKGTNCGYHIPDTRSGVLEQLVNEPNQSPARNLSRDMSGQLASNRCDCFRCCAVRNTARVKKLSMPGER